MPLFSIITPTYQNARFIRRCHWALTQQSLGDWEWIIVDDASTDGSGSVVAGLADPRIRYTRLPVNEGRGRARNRALRLAQGDWSVIMDMDDFCFPDRLHRAAETRSQGYDFLCSALALIDHDYRVRGARRPSARGYPRTFPHATLCGHSELLRTIGYPACRHAEDQTMVLTLANRHRGHTCDEPLYVYHENAHARLRDAFWGQHHVARQLRDLGRRAVLQPPAVVRSMRVRSYVKMAALAPFFLCPPLYAMTLRWRKNDVPGARALAPDRADFIAQCAQRHPVR